MKNLSKTILTVITHFIGFFCLYVLLDNLNTWIVTVFPDYGDLEDWWYEFTEFKNFHYIAATALLSGCFYFIWHFVINHIRSKGTLFLGLMIGEGLLVLTNNCYWAYLSHVCFGQGTVSLDDCYNIVFGSCDAAKNYFLTVTCAIFVIGIILCRFEYILRNSMNKLVIRQVCSGDTIYLDLLCSAVPACNMMTGAYYWGGINEIPIIRIISLVLGIVVIAHLLSIIVKCLRVYRYYRDAMHEDHDHRTLVIVREVGDFETSVVYHRFLKNRSIMQKLHKEHIYILPIELQSIPEISCIVLDIYSHRIFKLHKEQRQVVIDELLRERGTFNIAFCNSIQESSSICVSYDECTTNVDNALRAIITFSGLLEYRKKQNEIISKLHFGKLSRTNIFIDEIIGFKHYLECNTNSFLVFDYAIKWMEIVNYLCSLMSISRQGISVSQQNLARISHADFIKWSDFRKKEGKDEKVNLFLARELKKEDPVFATFYFVWSEVTSRPYSFSKYSINELLHALRELRNYTRGHGVFTFEISQEINLALIEILVFLINQLIESNLLEESYDNLDDLGWIIYIGDTPYFLYSYDNKYQECRYDSFQKGNSVTLPADIRRTQV